MNDQLIMAGTSYPSRLLVNSSKDKASTERCAVIDASGAEIVTIANSRTNNWQHTNEFSLLKLLSPEEFTDLLNTADSYRAEDVLYDTILMAGAFKKAIEAGCESYLEVPIAKKRYSAAPSSPTRVS
jgi:thiazole synthase ThiGH ThiG subunit